jgi:hypothetical protein
MATATPDCTQISKLLSSINNANAELGKIQGQMEDLGFGTVAQLQLITKLYNFISVVGAQSPKVLSAIISFMQGDDKALNNLSVDELKGVVSALMAHAELVIQGIPTGMDQTPQQKALLEAFGTWLQLLKDIVTQYPMTSADKLVAMLNDARKNITTRYPVVRAQLLQVFGAELAKAIASGAIEDLTDRKTLLKKLAEKVVISALGKAAASKVVPYIDVALTGWELIVQVAGNSAIKDVQSYIDQLTVQLVVLMKKCGWGWPQNQGKDQSGNPYYGFAVRTEKYVGATVVARPYIRCAKLVDGNPVFGDRCPVTFTTGAATITTKLTKENWVNAVWNITAQIDMDALQKTICITNAKYCYAYLQLTTTLADNTITVLNIICGVQTFP